MKVETYLVDEVESQTPEECEGARALVNKLGLNGQKKFTNATTDKPQPWRTFSHEEYLGLRSLCPQTTLLTDFSLAPIPARVLEIAEKAVESGFFDRLVVWHPADVRKDPVLVGEVHQPDSAGVKQVWNKREYILARWGESLEEMPALIRAARACVRSKLLDLKQRIESDLARIEHVASEKIAPDFSSYYSSPIR